MLRIKPEVFPAVEEAVLLPIYKAFHCSVPAVPLAELIVKLPGEEYKIIE